MNSQHRLFSYSGKLNGELINSILLLAESHLKQIKSPLTKKKKVINVLIECLQNIFYHSREALAENREEAGIEECLINISMEGQKLVITSGNFVGKSFAAKLATRLDYLNSLSPEDLRRHYLEVLDAGTISESGGAGLGLIRILRESGKPMEFAFEPAAEPLCFFNISVTMDVAA